MKHLKLCFACLLMAVLSIGQVWGETKSITITFSDNGSDNSSALTTANFTGQVNSGNDIIESVIATANCYPGTGGLKVSSNKNNGSFRLKLAQSLSITKVVLNIKNKNATTSSVIVGSTVFSTSDELSTSEFVDMEYTGTETSSDEIEVGIGGTANSKRVGYLASITIYHTEADAGGSGEPAVCVVPAAGMDGLPVSVG